MIPVNFTPIDDFLGLSPDEVHRLFYQPLTATSDIVVLNSSFDRLLLQGVPVIDDAQMLIRRIGENGELKATPRGNLPLKLVNELHEIQSARRGFPYFHVVTEEDLPSVYVVRRALTICGWVKFRNKKISLTKKGESIFKNGFSAKDYQQLMQCWMGRINWACLDSIGDFPIVQQAAFFLVYVLSKKAGEFVDASYLVELFLRAFPAALELIMTTPYSVNDPNKTLKDIFCLRFIERFCVYFGLLELKEKREFKLFHDTALSVRTTPLFSGVFEWKVSGNRFRVFVNDVATEHLQ